jgi:hypothetical protein
MPRVRLAVALACVLLAACASLPTPGMDEAQLRAKMGKPDAVRANADGSQTWEYPTGPLGRQTYMVTVGADRAVRDVRQVLSDEYFSQVRAGMSREDVRRLLGKPGSVSVFAARDEEVWSWRYLGETPRFFNVMFDRSAGTVRTVQRLDEILYMDHDS